MSRFVGHLLCDASFLPIKLSFTTLCWQYNSRKILKRRSHGFEILKFAIFLDNFREFCSTCFFMLLWFIPFYCESIWYRSFILFPIFRSNFQFYFRFQLFLLWIQRFLNVWISQGGRDKEKRVWDLNLSKVYWLLLGYIKEINSL